MPLTTKEHVPSTAAVLASPPSSEQTSISLEQIATPPPPDGGYGWVCVVAQFFINGFTWGVVAVRHTWYCVIEPHDTHLPRATACT
jgi:hypothetical protein